MDFESDNIDIDDIDVRTAIVTWRGDEAPEVEAVGCSTYEALGLFIVGIFAILNSTNEEDD